MKPEYMREPKGTTVAVDMSVIAIANRCGYGHFMSQAEVNKMAEALREINAEAQRVTLDDQRVYGIRQVLES